MRIHWDLTCRPAPNGKGWFAVGICRRDGQVDLPGDKQYPVHGLGDALFYSCGNTRTHALDMVTAYIRLAVAPGVAIGVTERDV
jgi:hypothetical protein